jgi:hypothetical protein
MRFYRLFGATAAAIHGLATFQAGSFDRGYDYRFAQGNVIACW